MFKCLFKKIKVPTIRIEPTEDYFSIPIQMTSGSSGFDIYSTIDVQINPMDRVKIPTGFKIHIPMGYELQIKSRSGLADKYGVMVIDSPAVIDNDYRGEVKVNLINLGKDPYKIERGDRVAQFTIARQRSMKWRIVNKINADTLRGSGGFGHTGR